MAKNIYTCAPRSPFIRFDKWKIVENVEIPFPIREAMVEKIIQVL